MPAVGRLLRRIIGGSGLASHCAEKRSLDVVSNATHGRRSMCMDAETLSKDTRNQSKPARAPSNTSYSKTRFLFNSLLRNYAREDKNMKYDLLSHKNETAILWRDNIAVCGRGVGYKTGVVTKVVCNRVRVFM